MIAGDLCKEFKVQEDVEFYIGESDRLHRIHENVLQAQLSTGDWWDIDCGFEYYMEEEIRFPKTELEDDKCVHYLSEQEVVILNHVEKEFGWMVRDNDGILRIYERKPVKVKGSWKSTSEYKDFPFKGLFNFLGEDDAPFRIASAF